MWLDEGEELPILSSTPHGLVFSCVAPHGKKLFRVKDVGTYQQTPEAYYVLFTMVYRGRRWYGKASAPHISRHTLCRESGVFAQHVAEKAGLFIEPDKKLTIHDPALAERNRDLTRSLRALVDLVQLWINGIFKKMGISWAGPEDWPPAIREALKLLGEEVEQTEEIQ